MKSGRCNYGRHAETLPNNRQLQTAGKSFLPEVFFRTVRASFAMRRKKLSNGLASGFPELGKTGAAEVIETAGFDANVRGETLGIPEFVRIANEIVKRRR